MTVPHNGFRCSVLTPPGRGAVATIALAGPGAAHALGDLFHSSGALDAVRVPVGRAIYGRWHVSSGEEVVLGRHGNDEFHLHCHGGAAAVRAILEDLAAAGGNVTAWQAWLQEKMPTCEQAAAALALTQARTERTANILLDQLHGALATACQSVWTACERGDIVAATSALRAIAGYAPLGKNLTQPFQVVLTGQPNVGKSSLINALIGFERAIVVDEPGTTRDIVTTDTAIDGWPVTLADTAGLRETSDSLEGEGVRRAQVRLATSDLVVLVTDSAASLSTIEAQVLADHPTALRVHNKSDLHPQIAICDQAAIPTSALTGLGIPQLRAAIAARLVPTAPQPGAAIPLTDEVTKTIHAALAALESYDLPLAQRLLAALFSSDA